MIKPHHLLRQPLRQIRPLSHPHSAFSTTSSPSLPQKPTAINPSNTPVDPDNLLSNPTWSITSLLPSSPSPSPSTPSITPHQLSHLLKLSALPPPSPTSPEPHNNNNNSKILSDLHSQLHFLAHLQSVNTSNVEPLSSIRDETPEGLVEAAITVDTLKEALNNEERVGKWKRPRRRRTVDATTKEQRDVEKWDVLGTACEKVTVGGGGYFVVRSGMAVTAE
ncbi:hypothetical protein QC761_306510 [Podospora bellae-mahoneyi]|uniref:A-agglutinin core protein AGA1 n=1 Tax=Podospora bellae-mahoneyi TaxID=2093777 RepID=A0ABR0FME8_9PEZI|nr:hypothetical protein QC761_306510 [Podospora bellae-mahoneyi]